MISDRASVSREARAVWDYYMNNRPDVIKQQLVDLHNTLTPEDEDNCDQYVAIKDAQGMHMPKNWKDDALSKLYKKSGTPVMDELRKRGMLR